MIPEKVRYARRESWRKIKRREKIYEGRENFPADHGRESWRADWDWSETARMQRHVEINSKIHPESEQNINNSADVSSKMFAVLRLAKKKWGSKAVRALTYYTQGKTEREAAALAGVTPRTLRNYVSKLKKEISQN